MERAVELIFIEGVVVVRRDGRMQACVRGRDCGRKKCGGLCFDGILYGSGRFFIFKRRKMTMGRIGSSDGPKEGAADCNNKKCEDEFMDVISENHFLNGCIR